MIARIAYSPPVPEDQLAKRAENLTERFKPALIQQPGLVAAFWLESPDGSRGSVTVWESEEQMQAAAATTNAVPLLPGHQREDLPGPDRGQTVQVLRVFDHHIPGRSTDG